MKKNKGHKGALFFFFNERRKNSISLRALVKSGRTHLLRWLNGTISTASDQGLCVVHKDEKIRKEYLEMDSGDRG